MKKFIKYLLLFIFIIISFFTFKTKVMSKKVNVYMFYGETCPHCEEAYDYLNDIKDKYNLKIYRYEVWNDLENRKLMDEIATYMDINVTGVPLTIIDNTAIFGYSKTTTDEIYKYHIKKASNYSFKDEIGIKLGIVKEAKSKKNKSYIIKIPIIGDINLKETSLIFTSLLMGIINGFNINILWILLIIMIILNKIKNKKKRSLLTLIFLFLNSIINIILLLFLSEYEQLINVYIIFRLILSIIIIILGIKNLNNYSNMLYSNLDNKNDITKNINKFINKNKFVILLIIITLLAIFNNIVRVMYFNNNSLIFKEILMISNLNNSMYIVNIFIYMMFIMLSNLIIYIILYNLIKTISILKNEKYFNLLSGIILLIIAILLIVKPELLMFN